MVIFHSYVKLPEGKDLAPKSELNTLQEFEKMWRTEVIGSPNIPKYPQVGLLTSC